MSVPSIKKKVKKTYSGLFQTKLLPVKLRLKVYTFFDAKDIIKSIAKLSSMEREELKTSSFECGRKLKLELTSA